MYGALVKFYDIFMAQTPYVKWLDFIASNLPACGSGADLGCGTGKITLGLLSRGYDVYGVDNSEAMLQRAMENAAEQNIQADFVYGDINKCKFLKKLDFVTAMCDAFNYVKDLSSVFNNISNNLVCGGKLIFDISSEYKLKNILGNHTYSDSCDGITYVWDNFLTDKKVDMELTFFEPVGELYAKTIETQTQYIHNTQDVLLALERSGFSVKAYGGANKSKIKTDSERIFFICVKGNPNTKN